MWDVWCFWCSLFIGGVDVGLWSWDGLGGCIGMVFCIGGLFFAVVFGAVVFGDILGVGVSLGLGFPLVMGGCRLWEAGIC